MIENRPRKRHRTPNLDRYIILSILAIIIYTIVNVWAACKGIMISDVLTTCLFAFFGSEVFHCALIKKLKLKGDTNNGNERNDI